MAEVDNTGKKTREFEVKPYINGSRSIIIHQFSKYYAIIAISSKL
jgi:hypothetical protein